MYLCGVRASVYQSYMFNTVTNDTSVRIHYFGGRWTPALQKQNDNDITKMNKEEFGFGLLWIHQYLLKPIFVDLVVELNYENRYDWSAISIIIYCNLLIKSLTTNSYVSLKGSYIHKIPKDWISRISQNPQRLNTANVNSHNRPLGINNK